MTVRRAALALVMAGAVLVATGCQGATPYALIVNGTTISQSEVLRELHAIAANKAFVTEYQQNNAQAAAAGQTAGPPIQGTGIGTTTYSQAFAAVILQTDLQGLLVHREVVRRHIEPSAKDISNAQADAAQQLDSDQTQAVAVFKQFSPWFQHLFQVRTAEELALTQALGPVDTSTKAVQSFYKDNPVDFITTECVSHILVSSQSQAESIRAKIEAGASFATMAEKYSTDTSSAVKGGSLGCSAPGNYVAPFEHVADTIAVNQLSQPVQSQFGWHLILVTSRQRQVLDAATSAKIVAYLQQQSPLTLFLTAQQATLSVHVNPEFGSWDPATGVVAPPSPGANSGIPTTTAAPAAAAPSTP
jgi:foldase protein PrsA